MRTLFFIPVAFFAIACNSSKKDTKPGSENNTNHTTSNQENVTAVPGNKGSASVTYTVDGSEITNYASLLVTKDKKDLNAPQPYLAILTSNAATHNNEYLNLNFLLDTKPGTYPVVGSSLQRGKEPNNEMYGGILGGKPALTNYKVTITECKDLGNHMWSLSGDCEAINIKAMKIMLMNKEKKHPEEITVQKIHFANLQFNDNLDELLKKGKDQLKKRE